MNELFLLVYYLGFTFIDAKTLPVWERRWYINRLNDERKAAAEAGGNNSRAAHENTPDRRFLEGRNRLDVPARLTRTP